jgi:hypothetical protein
MADHRGKNARTGGPVVRLRHCRTEQTVLVPLARYQQLALTRYRNWRLARGNAALRPPKTLSECVAHPDGARK